MANTTILEGQKIGFLTVLKRADDIVSPSGKKSVAWLCRCKCGTEIVVRNTTLKTECHYIRSCGCVKVANPNYKGVMPVDELIHWEQLYDYVNDKVMNYEKNMLSRDMVLRLKGMRDGKFFQDTKQSTDGIYPSKVILYTFKYCMADIQRAIQNNNFKSENHKFNYILKIVESNLNTVYVKMKKNEQAQKLAEAVDIEVPQEYVDRFKKRERPKMNPRLKSIF